MSLIKKILKIYLFVYKEIKNSSCFLLWALLLSTFATGIIPIITKYIMKVIISQLECNLSFNKITFIVSAYVFTIFIKNFFSASKEYINSLSNHKFTYNIQNKLIEKINKIEFKNFYSPDFQNNYNTILQNSQSESSNLMFTTIQMSSLIIQLITTCTIILNFNPIILISLLMCYLPTFILNMKNEKRRIRVIEECSLSCRKNFYYFNIFTLTSFIKEIRIFKLKQFLIKSREIVFRDYLKKWKNFFNSEFFKKIYSELLPCLCTFVSILLIVFEVIQKKYSVSSFIFFVGVIVSFKDASDALISTISRNYRSISFANKLINFLNDNDEIKSGVQKIKNKNHTLEFKNVYFKYPNSKKYSLKNINFTISTGEKIALVGKNGCGKTTLTNLILRLYDPTKGEILLDGINIKNYDYQEYSNLFSAIFQDYQPCSFKLTDYIASNINTNQKKLLKIKQAAKMTTADCFIKGLPKSWESNLTTRFDKDGLELSGGQWQKLAVARAFYSDAPILILDEPTSAMDATSESHIYKNIEKIGIHKTVIFISHRMYSSKIATKIIYMENNKIEGIGSHKELMKKSFGYKKLFEEQANKY